MTFLLLATALVASTPPVAVGEAAPAAATRPAAVPESQDGWPAQQARLRAGFWATVAVAAVGVGSAVGFGVHAQALYGNPQTRGTLQWQRRLLAEGLEVETLPDGTTVDHRARAEALRAQVETFRAASYVALGVASVAVATALVLWVLSAEPPRGEAKRQPAVRAAATLSPGFVGVALCGSF